MHGVTEDLDFHSCLKCQDIAREIGLQFNNGETYIFTSEQQIQRVKERENILNKDEAKI